MMGLCDGSPGFKSSALRLDKAITSVSGRDREYRTFLPFEILYLSFDHLVEDRVRLDRLYLQFAAGM